MTFWFDEMSWKDIYRIAERIFGPGEYWYDDKGVYRAGNVVYGPIVNGETILSMYKRDLINDQDKQFKLMEKYNDNG